MPFSSLKSSAGLLGAGGRVWADCVGAGKGRLGVGEPVSFGGNSLLPQQQHSLQKQEIAYY